MRAYFFALVASAAMAFSHSYTQPSFVQTDSDLDDDAQFDQPIELPEVETEPNADHAAVAAAMRRHKKSQVGV